MRLAGTALTPGLDARIASALCNALTLKPASLAASAALALGHVGLVQGLPLPPGSLPGGGGGDAMEVDAAGAAPQTGTVAEVVEKVRIWASPALWSIICTNAITVAGDE